MAESIIAPPAPEFWRGKRVFITGNTGFKGRWLAVWLQMLGAEATGFSLPEEAEPFRRPPASGPVIRTVYGDICQYAALRSALAEAGPEIVFHLAAQPLVRRSYKEPVLTYATNVLGTVHLLEAVRAVGGVSAMVAVTTDKCYADQGWPWAYRENDRLGGHDPYSSSKACAELVCEAWRNSFWAEAGPTALATARAGNAIGGGDWAEDRLIPDLVRSFLAGRPHIRRPEAVRPWQHVLEPLSGYLRLAELLTRNLDLAQSWNFGPGEEGAQTVAWMVRHFAEAWGRTADWSLADGPQPHETDLLRLDCAQARRRLGWRPRLAAAEALRWTADWYKRQAAGEDELALCREQISAYTRRREGD